MQSYTFDLLDTPKAAECKPNVSYMVEQSDNAMELLEVL
jgi:hypothetical protein